MFRLSVFLLAVLLLIDGPAARAAGRVRVLMIGDSLTVGTFGEVVHQYLANRFGSEGVAVFGSCGSKPQHWLEAEPEFDTRCGYREQTPERNRLIDFDDNGNPPPRMPTPKLENLLARYRPTDVIIQLGTNWMDDAEPGNALRDADRAAILDRMAAALGTARTVRQVIWITPPDSSHFSKVVQAIIQDDIVKWARAHRYRYILSSRITHYVRGMTGGDGIHYHKEAATAWALDVERELNHELL